MGIHEDPLFAGVTRPAMAMGVTYSALLINGMTTVELFPKAARTTSFRNRAVKTNYSRRCAPC